MLGKAMDFYIPGVPLEQLRAVGLYLQRGGVGFYPTSGSPFVHMDTGNVRHWPSIAANQMPRLMAQGHDLVASAEAADSVNRPVAVAKVSTPHSSAARPGARPAPAIEVAASERSATAATAAARPKAQPAPYKLASADARPVQLRPAQESSPQTPSANEIIKQRDDYWPAPASADTAAAPQPSAPARRPAPVPTAEPEVAAASTPWPLPGHSELRPGALAYAASQAAQPHTVHSGWMIQVGAFPALEEAKQRLSSVQSRAARFLGSADAFTEPLSKGETTWYRARFAGLDKEQAEAACNYLKHNDVDCMTIKN
jgi:hypothetical protein